MKIHFIILLFVFVFCLNSHGQTDSIKIETEVIEFNEEAYFKHKYNYLDIALKDENKLIKLGIQPFKPNDKFDFSVLIVHTSYESKLSKSMSFINEVNSTMTWSKGKSNHLTGYSLGFRHYYLKRSQIKEKTSGNNCNGPYVHIMTRDIVWLATQRIKSSKNKELYKTTDSSIKMELGLGIQQRLSRRLYFDGNVWANYDLMNGDKLNFGMTFLFGGVLGFWNE